MSPSTTYSGERTGANGRHRQNLKKWSTVRLVPSRFQAVSRHNGFSHDVLGMAAFFRIGDARRQIMAIHRIFVLGATFFLVALCPNIHAAAAVFILGVIVYSALWAYEILKRRKRS